MSSQFIRVQSNYDGTALEAQLFRPNKNPRKFGVLLAHPYGPLGGTMHNNVVDQLWHAFIAKKQWAVLRYNARGVSPSGGRTSWTGTAEVEDAQSLLHHFMQAANVEHVVLCGYSYGAITLSAVAEQCAPYIRAIVAISYPLGVGWFLTCFNTSMFTEKAFGPASRGIPKLFLLGDSDQFASCSRLRHFVGPDSLNEGRDSKEGQVSAPRKLVVIPGADHFWFGKEQEVERVVLDYLDHLGVESGCS